jgi:hypothetical protein
MFSSAASSATRPGSAAGDGDLPAASRRVASPELAEQYMEALREYTTEGEQATLSWAFQLGHRAVSQGLGLRDIVVMHETALIEALMLATLVADSTTRIVHRASEFLAVVLAPFEKKHRHDLEEHATLANLNQGLEQWLNATQHKLEAAHAQLREARKTDLRKNEAILALSRQMHGSLSMLKGLLGGDLNLHARRLLDEGIENSERVTRLVALATDAPPVEAAAASLGGAAASVGPAPGSTS